jgi:hypothetical protein
MKSRAFVILNLLPFQAAISSPQRTIDYKVSANMWSGGTEVVTISPEVIA